MLAGVRLEDVWVGKDFKEFKEFKEFEGFKDGLSIYKKLNNNDDEIRRCEKGD